MQQTDSDLVERCLQGERTAFAAIVERYKARIYYIAYSMTHSHADADDLSQEAFIKAYENLHRFKLGTSFRSWICRIVVNLSIDHLRRKKRHPTDSLENHKFELVNRNQNNPHKDLLSKELMDNITAAIDSLPQSQKTVVVLREIERMELPEIAAIMQCSQSTVRWRLHYARKKLRNKLRVYLEGG